MRFIFFLYQWLIAMPILLIVTLLVSLTTIIGCALGDSRFWGYHPPKIWGRVICAMLFVRVTVRGKENVDTKTSYVFVANHQSAFDIWAVNGYMGHPFKWMMKKSLEKIPFVGTACRSAGYIMVDHSSPAAVSETMQNARKQLQNGASLVIFPEGSRTRDGKMKPFKKGAFKLATDFGLPLVPITIDGAFNVMRRDSFQVHPGHITITIHKPVSPEMPDVINITHEIIESALK
ncbi:MAG: 1-acyl-sn-glycerol-3-phosphate acyltransferase [Muribaculaceae bacterium]|nr:1-acyl-sn-glycerol-3-phosphate acyltransferase [Muribaculaceae bacterium]